MAFKKRYLESLLLEVSLGYCGVQPLKDANFKFRIKSHFHEAYHQMLLVRMGSLKFVLLWWIVSFAIARIALNWCWLIQKYKCLQRRATGFTWRILRFPGARKVRNGGNKYSWARHLVCEFNLYIFSSYSSLLWVFLLLPAVQRHPC